MDQSSLSASEATSPRIATRVAQEVRPTPDAVAPPASGVSSSGHNGHEIKALTSFLKAIKAIGLYPEGSPVPEKIAAAFAADLGRCFEEHDPVQVTFRAGGVQLNGVALPDSGEGIWDLPDVLFELGLRDLNFMSSVTPTELCALVRQLSRAARRELDRSEEDLSVLLWEMDLPGITYRVVAVGDESEAQSSLEAGDDSEEDEEIREIWDSIHPVERYMADQDLPEDVTPDDAAFAVREEELELLRHAAKMEPSSMNYKLVLVLLELVLHDLPQEEFDRIMVVLPDAFLKLISAGHFHIFAKLCARLLDRVRRSESERERSLHEMGARLFSEQAAAAALGALRTGRCDDPEAAFLLLSALDAAGLRVVLEEVIEGSRGPGKAELRAIPARVISAVLAERPDEFFSDPELIGPEQMRYLAGAMGELTGDSESWASRMAPFLNSPDAEVRERAIEILCVAKPASIESILLSSLADEEPRVRHLAIQEASRILGPRAFAPLRDIVVGQQFAEKDFAERVAFIEAMTRSAPEEAFPILDEILRRRDWLAPKHRREEKAGALHGLGEAPHEQAMPLLLRFRKSRDPLLAEACRDALARQHRRAREAGLVLEQAA